MLDVISKKNSFFAIVNDRIFRYSLFGDNETLNIRFVSQQKTLCLSEEFNNILSSVSNNLSERKTLKTLCSEFYTNKRTIEKLFRENVGMTFHEHMTELRLGTAIALLFSPKNSVADIAQATGFSSSQNFSKFFSKNLKFSPTEFRASLQEKVFEMLNESRLVMSDNAGISDSIYLCIQSSEDEEKPLKSSFSVTPPPPQNSRFRRLEE